jgi:protein-S-isoprenylcysteine O-methyltransferase Ste14
LFIWASVRRLGKQWSLEARLTEGHQLITDGPYGLVRHPIYTGLLGMLIATGLALSLPSVIVVAVLIYLAATLWRTRMEERLLREAFPEEYAAYAARVPALIPQPWRRAWE